MKQLFGAAALAVAVLVVGQAQAADTVPGYDVTRQSIVSTLPLYLVAEQASVRPQVPYDRRPYSTDEPGNPVRPVPIGVGVVPALLGAAIVHGTELAAAKESARERWQWL